MKRLGLNQVLTIAVLVSLFCGIAAIVGYTAKSTYDISIDLEQEGLQAIATRVSTGDECSIVIEDGYVQGASTTPDLDIQPTKPAAAFSMPKF